MTFSDQAECSKGVCKPSSTSMFDNEDSSLEFEQIYATETEAQEALAQLIEKARHVESDPCEIESSVVQVEQGFLMKAKFNFCCQAEAVIFQLSLR
ncbi:hypothetical protein BMT54_02265 [Pasteurellaceae bacterium 15-036681]|nr:hypothetical protein BMT54_02265 [Pasteurellaceae bacterium 15-036681]